MEQFFLEMGEKQYRAAQVVKWIHQRGVSDIDAIVRVVSFPGWQQSISGEREVQKSLRQALLKYKLHKDQELFDRAYAYIKEYY
mgnify:CR=1 FL=1